MHKVIMVGFDDSQVLDLTGPLEVFGRTSRWLIDHEQAPESAYSIELVAVRPGPVRTSSGLEVNATRSYREVSEVDTLLVGGGIGYASAARDESLLDWLRTMAPRAERVGSICTGAMILAAAGLLDQRRATTHWAFCDGLAASGSVAVEPDAIYVRDGAVFTSAGVTAGMDMALAMVEEDWGRPVALAVARELVMYLKRPGGQSQFSDHLRVQSRESDRLQQLQLWILDNLEEDLSVARLAERAAMSPRTLARRFARQMGQTPAKFVEKARLQAARRRLEESSLPVETIAGRCGFGTAETMRRTFLRHLGVSPQAYRQRFGAA